MNIGGDPSDSFHRYKMSPIKITQRRKNGSSKTIITNFLTICTELNREPKNIEKFVSSKMNSRTNIENKELLIQGDHELVVIQQIIKDYIKDYVLCKNCNNPETVIVNNKIINALSCSACGSVCEINSRTKLNEKYNAFLLKNIKPSDVVVTKTLENKTVSKKEIILSDPMTLLISFMKIPRTSHEIYSELVRIKISRELDDKKIMTLLIKLYLQKKTINLIEILKLFNYRDQFVLDSVATTFIELEQKNMKLIISILENLREDYIDEDIIREWISVQNSNKEIQNHLSDYLKWLDNATEEDE